MDSQSTLATDARSLNALRRQAGSDPKSAVRAAAGQFESVFMGQMLKAMREAVPKSGMWDGPGNSTYTDMLDQQLAQTLSGRPGGLADVIARQLTRQMGSAMPAAVADEPAGAAGAAENPFGDRFPTRVAPAASGASSAPSQPAMLPPLPLRAPATGASSGTPAATSSDAMIRQALAAFVATGGAPTRSSGAGPAPGHAGWPGTATPPTGALLPVRASGQVLAAQSAQARWVDAAGSVSSPAKPDVSQLSGPQADFVRKVWPHALLAEKSTGVPAAFIVGQAALESGWGKHEIRNSQGGSSFNLFGIKANASWRGDSAAASTTEYVAGQPVRQVERFRAYGSYGEAFQDWAGMMARSPRYSKVIESGGSVQAFAANMQRAGYATDPAYGAKLEKVIQKTLSLQRLVT